ncbi:MAG: DNA/RNA nuclease SfsA [Oscillospiraceae bacterium]|nr:DNA/RNA nuclease SfsA [Oscillospiraceae bacterium]
MKYANIKKAVFRDRPNRFIAHVELNGTCAVCHVKNTGRCRELLIPGADVFVQEADAPNRKTRYDLISVYKGDQLINIDAAAPNKIFAEWVWSGGLFQKITLMQPEYRFGASRLDFYMEADGRRLFVEVKGVTLEENGVVRFPDAPTERGVRHLKELASCVQAGFDAYIVFIIQMSGARYFEPNWETHPAFGAALANAERAGVHIVALDCVVTPNSISAANRISVQLLREQKKDGDEK